MPTGIVTHKPVYDLLSFHVAKELPRLAAPHLNVEGAPLHEGGVTENEVIIRFRKGSELDINAPDISIHIRAHNFPERVKNSQERAERIHDACRDLLDEMAFENVSLSVELELVDLGYKASHPDRET